MWVKIKSLLKNKETISCNAIINMAVCFPWMVILIISLREIGG